MLTSEIQMYFNISAWVIMTPKYLGRVVKTSGNLRQVSLSIHIFMCSSKKQILSVLHVPGTTQGHREQNTHNCLVTRSYVLSGLIRLLTFLLLLWFFKEPFSVSSVLLKLSQAVSSCLWYRQFGLLANGASFPLFLIVTRSMCLW